MFANFCMILQILCNRCILEKFVDGDLGLEEEDEAEEVAKEKKERIRQRRNLDDNDDAAFDPEEAYLKINANLRTAFKKQHQLPLVSSDFRCNGVLLLSSNGPLHLF